MTYFFITVLMLGIFGFSVEINPHAQSWQLFGGFHLAGLVAISSVSLAHLRQLPTKSKRYVFILLQMIAFRIAYFPVVVFSATVSCYSELMLSHFSINLPIKIFPAMFVSAAILFSIIGMTLFWALNGKKALYALLIIMGTPALLISFVNTRDLTIFPDNNLADINPLPQIALPKKNPYGLALTSTNYNVGQKMIGLAGKTLYDFIPNAPWSQLVQGTLEQAYLNNPDGNAHDQLRYHYGAFLAAHDSLSSSLIYKK
ncbi:MAG: hypothetical protein RL755_1360 [Pseudomonadota bacterium]